MRAAIAAAAMVTIVAPGAWATRAPVPSLQLAQTDPVIVVVGSHFRAGEHVTVTVSAATVQTRRIAVVHGGFRLTLDHVVISHCGRFAISAVGTAGSRAALKVPRPACLPVRSPGSDLGRGP